MPLSAAPRVLIVIPALNEAAHIAGVLNFALGFAERAGGLVVVADGGSTDGTVARARAVCPSLRLVTGATGRGAQMRAGAAAATGDALLFLHADTALPDGALDAVREALATDGVAGGCFETTFDTDAHAFRALGRTAMRLWQARLWMRWHRLAFGDRALFCSRTALDAAGGVPDLPLFEDLELVARLRRVGRFVFLPLPVVTSARRFLRHGAVRQQARNLLLWLLWLAGADPARLARWYPAHRAD